MATKTEVERLGMLEQKVGDGFKNIDRRFDEVIKRLDDSDNKYAGKWTEKFAIAVLLAVGLFFLNSVLGLFKIPTLQTSNSPTTSSTTTTTTPTGSTATTSTKDTSTTTAPNSQPSSGNGGVNVALPKVP